MIYKVRLSFLVLFAAMYLAESQFRFECGENFCNKKENECPKSDCKDGRVVKHATRCGCCDICIKHLNEGEKCSSVIYGMSEKLEECGPGLVCDKTEKRCVPASTKCIRKREEFDESAQNMLQPKPECEEFGYFKPVTCIPDVLCYCVDKYGERIFGTDLFRTLPPNNETMKCDCSRDIKDFPSKVADGNFPRCLPNGNYDPLQCSDDVCFCMESLSPEEDIVSVNASIKKLSCYNKLHHEDRFSSKCWKERANQQALLKNESFSAVIGLDLVQCDLDGSFYPLQCRKNRCYCVNKNGKPYDGSDIARNSEDSERICHCFRDKDFLMRADKRVTFIDCNQLGSTKG